MPRCALTEPRRRWTATSRARSPSRRRTAVATMIGNAGYVGGVWSASYQGWDELAGDLIAAVLAAGNRDVDAAINPGAISSIFTTGASYRAGLHAALSGALTASNEAAL